MLSPSEFLQYKPYLEVRMMNFVHGIFCAYISNISDVFYTFVETFIDRNLDGDGVS